MGHRDLLVTHKLSEAENQDCRYHPRGTVRRASGFVLTGKTEVILKLALMGHCPGRHPSRLRAGARGPQLFQQRARSPYYRNHDEMGQGRRVTLDWKALGV